MRFRGGLTFLVVAFALASATTIYFGPFINNFFTYDDFGLIEHVNKGPISVILGYNYILRIVANCVWIPIHFFSGLDPQGYNLFSISLHFLNSLLVYVMISRLFEDRRLAAISSLFFVTTAVGVDAILWRAANSTPLNLFFYLLTLTCFVEYRKRNNRSFYFASIGFFVLAVLSKEESASLPLVAAFLEILFFEGISGWRGTIKRILPYCGIIVLNVVLNYLVIYQILQVSSELVRHTSFRPLHSLFSGWTVFFLQPDGRLNIGDYRIYVTAILIPLSLFWVKDRRLLFFGLGWVFLSFLPQSLSSLSQFEPKYIFNSISRHLYLPSVGAAFCYAVILRDTLQRFGKVIGYGFTVIAFSAFLMVNYKWMAERGKAWEAEGIPVKVFLKALKQKVVQFPPNTYFFALNGPTGRAYMQQSLRAFYNNPTITWIVDPATYVQKPNQTAILLDVVWADQDSIYNVKILPFSLETLYQRMGN